MNTCNNPYDLVDTYNSAFKNLYTLCNELESKYGRFLPGSPEYIEILKDMANRNISDNRIQPTIDAYESIMKKISTNIEAIEILRRC